MIERPFQPQVFAILAALVEDTSGLHYGAAEAPLAWQKIATRADEAGFESLLDYYYFLRYDDRDGTELRALLDALVVRETYFFREHDQLVVLVEDVLGAAVERTGRARVWSAACSTGEEPLSVAMMLARRDLLDRVEIVASDVSARSLALARSGRFGRRSTRAVPLAEGARRWLREEEGGVAIDPVILKAVRFQQLNLLDEGGVRSMGTFDAVLCRNVLIYFAEPTIERVVRSLAGALAPRGALLVGVSESLMRVEADLRCEERRGAFLYRRGAR